MGDPHIAQWDAEASKFSKVQSLQLHLPEDVIGVAIGADTGGADTIPKHADKGRANSCADTAPRNWF